MRSCTGPSGRPRSRASPVDLMSPRMNPTFLIDPARVGCPQDTTPVERAVRYVRRSLRAGARFVDLVEAQRRAETWLRGKAGMRKRGAVQSRPVEAPVLLPARTSRNEIPREGTSLKAVNR